MLELDRRSFLKTLPFYVIGLASIASGCHPTEQTPSNPDLYMVLKNRQLGEEINSWALRNGVRMVDRFAEIRNVANLLTGSLDPRKYFPFASIPIGFSADPSNGIADLFFDASETDFENPRRIIATDKDGQKFELPFLRKGLQVQIRIAQEFLGNTVRLPLAAKEASQLAENLEYATVYVNLLRAQGASFILHNPQDSPTTNAEIVTSIAYTQAELEKQQTGKKPWFHEFLDFGSMLRVGAIASVNWYTDQLDAGFKPTGRMIDIISQSAGFLQSKGLIRQEGRMFVWTNGKPPSINSAEFLQLFNQFTGRI